MGVQGREAGPPRSPRGAMGTVSGRVGVRGAPEGPALRDVTEDRRVGWAGAPQGDPPCQGAVCGKGPGSVRVSPGKETVCVPEDVGKPPGE